MENNTAWLGDRFVKSDGSIVDRAYLTSGKLICVLWSATW